jgi:hypothetical protein
MDPLTVEVAFRLLDTQHCATIRQTVSELGRIPLLVLPGFANPSDGPPTNQSVARRDADTVAADHVDNLVRSMANVDLE